MPSRIRTSRLISSHIKRCHLLFASYGHIAGDSHGVCWSVNDRSSGHSGPGWYHQEWKEFLASSNNVTHHSHWSVFHGNHVTFQTFPHGKVWLPGRSRTWIPWPSPRDRGTKPRTHCCVRACFRQKSRPSREPTQKPCIADAVSGVQIRTRNENWQEQCGFTVSGKPAPSCSKIQALRIKPSATTLLDYAA